MLKFKKLLLTLPAMMLVLSMMTATAFAHPGHDHGDDSVSSTPADQDSNGTSSSGDHGSSGDHKRSVSQKIEDEARANEHTFRRNGTDLLQQLRSGKQARTAQQRQDSCAARKVGLQRKVDNLESNAQKHLTHFDEVFVKVSAYQKAKNLSVEKYDDLVAAATAAQSKAIASMQALITLKPSVDCSKDTVASDVAAFKSAAAQTRTDLSAYKKAVRDILQAVIATKEKA